MFWIVILKVVEWLVLAILAALSVWSVSIMIDRKREFEKETSFDSAPALKMIRDSKFEELKVWLETQGSKNIQLGVLKTLFEKNILSTEADRAVKGYLTEERLRLEKGFSVLATLGANAPFIGLFGTVLGIIQAFAVLAGQEGGGASVMAGVSVALVATAAGLFVAIPATVSYNYFSKKLRTLLLDCELLKDQTLSRLSRS